MIDSSEGQVHPQPGEMLPEFDLPSLEGRRVSISDFRGRINPVLIFTGGAECGTCRHEVLMDLCREPEAYTQVGGEILVVVRCSLLEAELVRHRDRLTCPVLLDEDGQVHRAVSAVTPDGQASTSVFVADRQFKICLASRTWQGDPIPTRHALLESLRSADDHY